MLCWGARLRFVVPRRWGRNPNGAGSTGSCAATSVRSARSAVSVSSRVRTAPISAIHRTAGVRFRTSVLTHAASAAAILVALGDERIAAPGASLLFHGSRVYRRGQMSARDCSELNAVLSRSDDELIRRLVTRALAGPLTPAEHGAKRSDRQVLEGLCLGPPPDPSDTAPARLQTLASALGQTGQRQLFLSAATIGMDHAMGRSCGVLTPERKCKVPARWLFKFACVAGPWLLQELIVAKARTLGPAQDRSTIDLVMRREHGACGDSGTRCVR